MCIRMNRKKRIRIDQTDRFEGNPQEIVCFRSEGGQIPGQPQKKSFSRNSDSLLSLR